ncbi:MAG: DUF4272 domain-containing protein [Lachnospiraceae bacterium]|jgi:hypothetical protein|nr:DUF4272 domain-containing protein [Lachnospiraceae bacterium]
MENLNASQNIILEERRKKNNDFILQQSIACYEDLPLTESSAEVTLKSVETIAKRAIGALLVIQVIYDIQAGDFEGSVEFFRGKLKQFDIGDELLNSKELRILNGTYTQQDLFDMDWAYEAVWSLYYALGLVDDIRDGGETCDCELAISLVSKKSSFDEFVSQCKLRDIEEILDMLDLYYRYDWAVTENRIRPNTNIGNLVPSNVVERRRGLEWLISEEDDWYDLSLDT